MFCSIVISFLNYIDFHHPIKVANVHRYSKLLWSCYTDKTKGTDLKKKKRSRRHMHSDEIKAINLGAGIKWLLSLGVFLRIQLHVWDHGKNSAAENTETVKPGLLQHAWMKTGATHLHRCHGVASIVMDGLPLAVWVWVTKPNYVDNIAIVEGNKHCEDASGRMNRFLKNKCNFMATHCVISESYTH